MSFSFSANRIILSLFFSQASSTPSANSPPTSASTRAGSRYYSQLHPLSKQPAHISQHYSRAGSRYYSQLHPLSKQPANISQH